MTIRTTGNIIENERNLDISVDKFGFLEKPIVRKDNIIYYIIMTFLFRIVSDIIYD